MIEHTDARGRDDIRHAVIGLDPWRGCYFDDATIERADAWEGQSVAADVPYVVASPGPARAKRGKRSIQMIWGDWVPSSTSSLTVVTKKLVDTIGHLFDGNVELIPVTGLPFEAYVCHVRRILDLIDDEASEGVSVRGTFLYYDRIVLKATRPADAHVFCLRGLGSRIYTSTTLMRACREGGLLGARFLRKLEPLLYYAKPHVDDE